MTEEQQINKQIAETILEQLGGKRFAVMTGAKNFCAVSRGVSFRLPSTPHFVRDGINVVEVKLMPSDTYTVKFSRMWGHNIKLVSEHTDIYCDTIRDLFTEVTGLATSLGTMRAS